MLAVNELKSLSRSVLTRKMDARYCILDGLKESLMQFGRISRVKQVCIVYDMKASLLHIFSTTNILHVLILKQFKHSKLLLLNVYNIFFSRTLPVFYLS